MERQGCFYLNNKGSRWVILPRIKYYIKLFPTNEIIQRKAKYFYSFGNFSGIAFSYNGKTETSLNYSTKKEDIV